MNFVTLNGVPQKGLSAIYWMSFAIVIVMVLFIFVGAILLSIGFSLAFLFAALLIAALVWFIISEIKKLIRRIK